MDVASTVSTDVTAAEVFAAVSVLDRYPSWLDFIAEVESVDAVPSDVGPAWLVELAAQLGPFRRSKRLRMVRTVCEPTSRVRFERRELDGRDHSPWVLSADVADDDAEGALLTMRLHYGGSLVVPLLDRVLAGEIDKAIPRLLASLHAGH